MRVNFNQLVSKFMVIALLFVMSSGFAMAQTVSGTVTGDDGDALVGANIVIKGTTTGTITDIDGKYSLSANKGDVLVFSFVGFQPQEMTVDGSTINMVLSSSLELDELVVVGYGAVKKSDLTGSVSQVAAEDFNRGVQVAPENLIQGKVAGVQILNNSGQPGGAATVRIRGNSSVRSGNQPLYVVDGVPLDGGSARPGVSSQGLGSTASANPLNFINPNDIASIQVLKDASATAIYGSRGANGVVIIETKKGRVGAPTIDFGVSLGTSSILNQLDVLNGDEYRDALTQYGLTGGDFGGNEDAMDAVLRSATTQNYNFAIGGGSSKGSYRISGSYLDQEGIILDSGIKKYTGGVRGSYKFFDNDILTVDFNLLASHSTEDLAPVSDDSGFQGDVIAQALQWNPTRPLENNGVLDIDLGGTTINPLAYLRAYDDVVDLTTILGSISPSVKLAEGLTYKYLFSINQGLGTRTTQTASWINVDGVQGRGWANYANNKLLTKQHTHTLNYNTDLSSEVSLNALVGYEYQKFDERGIGFSGQDFLTDDLPYVNIFYNSSTQSRGYGGFVNPSAELQSYFARANVNLSDKYLITATVRADGSSKFGENNKYGVFPSFAVAWNLSNEDFMTGGAFDNLKVRVGWGQTGNQEFPAGASQERYAFGNNGAFTGLENVANPDLQWETSTTLNAGIDFAILGYKLTGSIDYFNKVTENLLFNFETIQPAPAGRYWVNLDGQVVNSGVEIGLNSRVVETDALTWELGGNISFLNNELSGYEGPTILTGALHGQGISGASVQRLENGQPLNSFYVRDWEGIGEDGNDVLVDDGNSMFFLGDPNPDVLLGITTTLTAGDFSLVGNLNGAFGHVIYNNTLNSVIPIGNLGSRNVASSLLEGSNQESIANSIKSSDRYLENGGYTKLANMTISYNLGNIGSGIKNARVSLTGQNLAVFTGYTGFDPEVNADKQINDVPSFGIEYSPYPSARTLLFGLNFSF